LSCAPAFVIQSLVIFVLLPRHRYTYPVFRRDKLILVVFAEIDLHPMDFAAKPARVPVVIFVNLCLPSPIKVSGVRFRMSGNNF